MGLSKGPSIADLPLLPLAVLSILCTFVGTSPTRTYTVAAGERRVRRAGFGGVASGAAVVSIDEPSKFTSYDQLAC